MVEDKLRKYADRNDITFEEAQEALNTIIEDRFQDADFTEEQENKYAFRILKTSNSRQEYVPSAEDKFDMLTIGHRRRMEWGDDNDGVVITYAIAQEPGGKTKLTSCIFRESDLTDSDLDLEELPHYFRPLNTIQCSMSPGDADRFDCFILNSAEGTEIREVDNVDFLEYDEVETIEDRRQWLNNNYFQESVPIADLPDIVSNTDGFEESMLELDMHRIEGIVADHYVNPDSNAYFYTIQDDSVDFPDEYPDEVTGGDERPGLTVWSARELMDYGNDSILDFYGAFSENEMEERKGEITMTLHGVAPLPGVANEEDLEEVSYGDNDDDEEDDDVEGTSFL